MPLSCFYVLFNFTQLAAQSRLCAICNWCLMVFGAQPDLFLFQFRSFVPQLMHAAKQHEGPWLLLPPNCPLIKWKWETFICSDIFHQGAHVLQTSSFSHCQQAQKGNLSLKLPLKHWDCLFFIDAHQSCRPGVEFFLRLHSTTKQWAESIAVQWIVNCNISYGF